MRRVGLLLDNLISSVKVLANTLVLAILMLMKAMTKNYRQGAIGALLDEYERAITNLKKVIGAIPDNALTIIVDRQTADENCRSVQRFYLMW